METNLYNSIVLPATLKIRNAEFFTIMVALPASSIWLIWHNSKMRWTEKERNNLELIKLQCSEPDFQMCRSIITMMNLDKVVGNWVLMPSQPFVIYITSNKVDTIIF